MKYRMREKRKAKISCNSPLIRPTCVYSPVLRTVIELDLRSIELESKYVEL